MKLMEITARTYGDDGKGGIYMMSPLKPSNANDLLKNLLSACKANESTAGFGVIVTIDDKPFYDGPLNEIIAYGLEQKLLLMEEEEE